MRFSIDRETLLPHLEQVSKLPQKTTTHPILQYCLLVVSDGSLSITTTDLEREITTKIGILDFVKGSTCAPAEMLFQAVKRARPKSVIVVEAARDRVTVSAGKSSYSFSSLPASDYPRIHTERPGAEFQVSAPLLKSMISRTKSAMSDEPTRYYLNGIYLHVPPTNGQRLLRAVATDGHRLSHSQIDAPEGADKMNGVIIPSKTVEEMDRLLSDEDGMASISATDERIKLTIGDTQMISKLVAGSFPDYMRVIPAPHKNTLIAPPDELSAAIKRLQVIKGSDKVAVGIKIEVEHDLMRLSRSGVSGDSGTDEVSIISDYTAEIGVDPKYMEDILGTIEGDFAKISIGGGLDPILIRDGDRTDTLHVIMPMRT